MCCTQFTVSRASALNIQFKIEPNLRLTSRAVRQGRGLAGFVSRLTATSDRSLCLLLIICSCWFWLMAECGLSARGMCGNFIYAKNHIPFWRTSSSARGNMGTRGAFCANADLTLGFKHVLIGEL